MKFEAVSNSLGYDRSIGQYNDETSGETVSGVYNLSKGLGAGGGYIQDWYENDQDGGSMTSLDVDGCGS